MILSDGNNEFKDNTFHYWTWSAPIFQTAEEVTAFVHEQKLIGRVIKDIRAVSNGYNWHYGYFSGIYKAICKEDRKALDSLEFPCSVEIDDPLLIMFEDGDILGIDFSEGSSLRMGMNTLPWDIRPWLGDKNFHAGRLFGDILGSGIYDIVIASSIIQPTFTGSHGLDLAEQPSYLDSFSFVCQTQRGKGGNLLNLKFNAMFDYGVVSLRDRSAPISLPAARLPEILEGYMSREDMKHYFLP